MLSYVSRTRKCSPFLSRSSVCILVPDVRKLKMKNKTKERTWDNHIDLCAKTCEGKDEAQAISDSNVTDTVMSFARALHGKPVCLSSPVPLHGTSSQQPALLLAPIHPVPWQPKGATDACTGGCHSNLNRQTRNEFHHQRLASKLNSISLSEKHSDGKCLHHTSESCSCPQCLSHTSFLSPRDRDVRCNGQAEARRRWCTASAAPREGVKPHWKPGSAKASHKTESQIHHKWSSLLCLPRGSNIDLYKGMVQSPTFIPRAQSHLGVYTAPKISTSQ